MDAAAIRGARAALSEQIAVLSEARRRLMEAEAQPSADAIGVAPPSTAGGGGGGGHQLAGGGVLDDAEPVAAEQETRDDDFYPLDDAPSGENEGDGDATPLFPMRRGGHWGVDLGNLEEASSGDRGGMLVDDNPELDDDDDDGFAECMRRIRQAAAAGRLRVDPPSAGADQLAGAADPVAGAGAATTVVRHDAGLRNDVQDPIADPSCDDGDNLQHDDTTNSMDLDSEQEEPHDFYPVEDDSVDDERLLVRQWMWNLFHGSESDDEDDQSSADEGLHVPNIQSTSMAEPGGGGGFGAVPASAAAIAGLEKQRYQSSDSSCAICMEDYAGGSKLSVMPCEHKHRFHSECLDEWLARSHLCPLCRHALPTEEEEDAHRSPRVHGDDANV